jgi:hypothetical protein
MAASVTKRARIVVLFTFVFISLCGTPFAQEAQPATSALFLTSTPIGADVLHNGEALDKLTPVLLRDLPPGRHALEVRKEGYSYRAVSVDLEPGQVESVSVNLAGEYLLPSFPEEGSLEIRGTAETAEDQLFQIPQGSYTMRRGKDGTLAIEPQYGLQGWLTGLNLAVPLALAFSGVLTVHDIAYPKRSALKITPSFSLSPVTLSAYGVSLALIGFDITLHVLKARFLKSFRYSAIPARESLYKAREYFDRAESLLSLGQLEEAQRFYTVLLDEYRGSPLYPEALFKIARIHALGGDETMAAMELELLIERYPTPALYDKARKTLADLAFARGAYEDSLEQLDAMVFADPLFVAEEIDQYRAEILEAWAGSDPAVLPRVVQAYEGLISRYPESTEIPRYRFELALYLHENGRDQEAGAQLELLTVEGLEPSLADRIRDLKAEIGEGR